MTMDQDPMKQELHHEIFGSILDRTEMTPFLLLPARDYSSAVAQAGRMMSNRGFDVDADGSLVPGEAERAYRYMGRVYQYSLRWLFPFVRGQLNRLAGLGSPLAPLYRTCLEGMAGTEAALNDPEFRRLTEEDPRHLFLLASARRYPHIFDGYGGGSFAVADSWQQAACSVLKMAHLIKSVEEDSQDINDFAQLGFFLESEGQSLEDLYRYDWSNPRHIPDNEPAQRAFVKVSTFFHKLQESLGCDEETGSLVFNSGDGVSVGIAEIKARLKSPASMFTKIGKDVEGEAYDIRDIVAITFILKSMDDTLTLFHALQKRGVILQENTASHSITQTLFESPEAMKEAVRRLMTSLARSSGRSDEPSESELDSNARSFYEALSLNTARNLHSSRGHRKFQCKIAFSLPVHRATDTGRIITPGTPAYDMRDRIGKETQQHTLGVELRISDELSWKLSEQKGESHHDAYKFRQLVAVMNRIFPRSFSLPEEHIDQLRKDQMLLFS